MKTTIDMAREVYGAHTEWNDSQLERLESLFALVRADEREACAKQLNALGNDHCAAAIRNRGNT
jgi:hypothetical protein